MPADPILGLGDRKFADGKGADKERAIIFGSGQLLEVGVDIATCAGLADIAARNQQSNWKHFIAGSDHESFKSIKSFGPGGCDEDGGDAS